MNLFWCSVTFLLFLNTLTYATEEIAEAECKECESDSSSSKITDVLPVAIPPTGNVQNTSGTKESWISELFPSGKEVKNSKGFEGCLSGGITTKILDSLFEILLKFFSKNTDMSKGFGKGLPENVITEIITALVNILLGGHSSSGHSLLNIPKELLGIIAKLAIKTIGSVLGLVPEILGKLLSLDKNNIIESFEKIFIKGNFSFLANIPKEILKFLGGILSNIIKLAIGLPLHILEGLISIPKNDLECLTQNNWNPWQIGFPNTKKLSPEVLGFLGDLLANIVIIAIGLPLQIIKFTLGCPKEVLSLLFGDKLPEIKKIDFANFENIPAELLEFIGGLVSKVLSIAIGLPLQIIEGILGLPQEILKGLLGDKLALLKKMKSSKVTNPPHDLFGFLGSLFKAILGIVLGLPLKVIGFKLNISKGLLQGLLGLLGSQWQGSFKPHNQNIKNLPLEIIGSVGDLIVKILCIVLGLPLQLLDYVVNIKGQIVNGLLGLVF